MKRLISLLLLFAICFSLNACSIQAFGGYGYERPSTYPVEEDATEEESVLAYDEKLSEVMAIIDRYYVDDYDEKELGDYLAQAAVAATGDKWSYYISAEEYASYLESNANAYVGVGITISLLNEDDPGFTVTAVTRGGPADAAGVRINDIILAVDGVSAIEEGMTGCQQLVRGEAGTDVTITFQRGDETFDLTITRALIETPVVTSELLSGGHGYIKINNFDDRCARESIAAIESLLANGATGLIFDLRFNPGGHLSELITLLDYLLPEGPIFRSVDYRGQESVEYSDESWLDMPMAVLVNEDSYSAAEFFAAALQEYEMATIVGTQTTGKANYQQTFTLSDGSAIAISTGHYQTPNGVTLADVGVTPDVIVEVDDETYVDLYYELVEKADDVQLQAAISAFSE